MEKIVKDYLETLGYKENIDEEQETRVTDWLEWYKGTTKKHKYSIYNGISYNTLTLKSLNIASQSCNDLSDFFFNEKLDITIDDENAQKAIKECLDQNNFLHNANNLMQLTEALGTGAIVSYLDNGVLKLNFINATNIVILEADKDTVDSVMFWSKKKVKDGYEYYFNTHILTDKGYVIKNRKCIDRKGNIEEVPIDEKIAEINTNSYIPRFAILKTCLINNCDINSPYGISIYENAKDNILAIDRAYDSLDNEIALGRKRIYVKGGASKFNTAPDGTIRPIFDSNDTVYYQLPGEENDPLITESKFDLRIDELTNDLQAQLNLYTSKIGLGHNYYKFKAGEVYTNTDQVMSSNSDVYRKIKKQENIITYALTNLIYGIAQLIGITNKFNISINYDDTIIENTDSIRAQAQSEFNNKLISKAQYYRDVYGLKDDSAIKFAEQMNKEIASEEITEGTEPSIGE